MKTRAVSIVFTVGVLAVLPGGAMNPGVNQAAARPFMLAEPTFPDTAPGRIAKAFLEAVGDPTEAKVAAFEAAHGSSTRRAAMSIAERAERFRDLRNDLYR